MPTVNPTSLKIVFILLLTGISILSFGQSAADDCSKILDTEPYFVKHHVKPTDSLLLHDIAVLKHCGSFDQIDSELLKGPVLSAVMNAEMDKGRPATYRTIINYVIDFRKTEEYKEFKTGVLLYRSLENKTVNLKDWDSDQMLFVRMGFTASDLDDFKEYISAPEHQKMTYKQAYVAYINEIEALGTKNKS